MKKFFALFLMALAVLAMTSCGGKKVEKTAYELFLQSQETLNKADSVLMDLSMIMEMDYSGMTMEISMTGSISQVMKDGVFSEMSANLTMSMFGFTVPMEIYYKDGFQYQSSMGEKTKTPMSIEEAMEDSGASMSQIFTVFPEAAIKNQEVKDVDGGKELLFTLDSKLMNEQTDGQMNALSGITGSETDELTGDVEMKVVLDKNNSPKSAYMFLTVDSEVEDGETTSVKCEITVTYTKIGGVKIEFPDDLDTYEYVEPEDF